MTALLCIVTLSGGVESFDQWFVVAIHHHVRIACEVVTKMFDGKIESPQFSRKSGILALSWRKTFGKEREWSPDIGNFLHYGSPQPKSEASETKTVSASERGCANVA